MKEKRHKGMGWQEADDHCAYCGRYDGSIDFIIPLNKFLCETCYQWLINKQYGRKPKSV